MITRKRKVVCILLALVCIATLFLVSCKKDPVTPNDPVDETPSVDYGIDSVYYMVEGENEYLFTISGNTFMISGINGDQSGTFTYADGALTLTFKEGDSTSASAVIENGVLKLTYNGNAYRMFQRVQHTVTYDLGDGTVADTQKVINGLCATKPADPVKAGYAFIGWYADKNYTTVFAFDSTIITADTTLYARFEEQPEGSREYTGILIAEGTAYDPVKTVNGVLYNLPTPAAKDGNEFAGWWVSDYQTAKKLTYQYTGQKLTQDVTLYAVYKSADTPLVSISATGATWNALGANISYRVTVRSGDNVIAESNTGSTEYKFDFSSYTAGDYSVTVTANEKSGTAYYRNKALDRVSNIRVISSNVLVFDPVPGADQYTITFTCGNPTHEHSNINNGKSTYYVFSNCDMPEEGIVFAVSASANGYLDSIATYQFYQELETVKGVTIDNAKVTWYPVDNATMYKLGISTNGMDFEYFCVTDGTSYSIAHYDAGVIYATVQPISSGYYSKECAQKRFVKTTLAMPAGISVSGKTLTWDAVEGATGYNISINDTVYQATENTLELTDDMLTDGVKSYDVAVQALADDSNANSPYSETVVLGYATMSQITYKNGYVYWSPALGAAKYYVRVGTALPFEVKGSEICTPVTFADSGNVEITVWFTNENGDASAESTITVEVFSVELDVRGGSADDAKTLYRAFGDDLNLPTGLKRIGYNFAGWYNTPNGLSHGKEFTFTRFEGNEDIVLYAAWSAQRFTITLDPGSLAEVTPTTIEVVYGSHFELPIPEITDDSVANLFTAWYSEPNGSGIVYTNERGESLFRWNVSSDVTLYAAFEENALKFTEVENGAAYAVSQGDYGIGNLTEITIPVKFKGKYVTTIEAAGFASCTSLVTINIPNTVTNIELGTLGVNDTGSAFQGCRNLANINIYDAGAKDAAYFSVDGVLYYNNPYTAGIEIKAYPYAKGGVLNIAVGTTSIPVGVFNNTTATEIHVPYTVKSVGAGAFSSYKLESIIFDPIPDDAYFGTKEEPLTLADGAIKSCSYLTKLVLPGRLENFTAKTITSCAKLSTIEINGTSTKYSAREEYYVAEAGKEYTPRKVLCNADGSELIFCPKGMSGKLMLPNTVTQIGDEAFKECRNLTEIVIPGRVTRIGDSAFESATKLGVLTLEDSGTGLVIGDKAFYNCYTLTQLTLPERLYKLGEFAFGKTSSLAKVTVLAAGDASNKVDFATNAFGTDETTPKFYVTTLLIGAKVPTFDVTGVFGQMIERIEVDKDNQYYTSQDGVLYDKAVTEILFFPSSKDGAFELPDTIVRIGARTFQGKNISAITIGNKVKTIDEGAFQDCKSLTTVTFVTGGTDKLEIGDNAFRGCNLVTAFELPDRLKTIGEGAFYGCSTITAIVVPEGTTEIGSYAFGACNNLETVSLPSTLTKLGMSGDYMTVFCGEFGTDGSLLGLCNKLTTLTVADDNKNFRVIDNILYGLTKDVTTTLLFCPVNKAGEAAVVVPSGVTEVAAGAFYSNLIVTSVTFNDLSEGQTLTLGDKAFGKCLKLATIALPNGMLAIADGMFKDCTSLTKIVIPYTVATIGTEAFSGCTGLTELEFLPTPEGTDPVSLKILDAASYNKSAFYNCKKLTEITFPERTTYLGAYAFGGAAGGYDSSGYYESGYATSLVTVKFPSTLKSIGKGAFSYATNLTTVEFAAGTILEDSGSTAAIGESAFEGCNALEHITLPSARPEGDTTHTYSIGKNAFYNSALTEIYIPAVIGNIGEAAFKGNYSTHGQLKSLTFEEGTKVTFGKYAFQYSALETVTLPEGITTISQYMFSGCNNLTTITIPKSVTTIDIEAFSSCKALSSIHFATDENGYSSITKLGNKAFSSTALTSFTFPTRTGNAALTLGTNIFGSCKELKTVTLSPSVKAVEGLFAGCASITTINTEGTDFAVDPTGQILCNKNLTSYLYAFRPITGEFTIGDKITLIGAGAFQGQNGITKLIIPYSVTSIGNQAFNKCKSLKEVVFTNGADGKTTSQLTTLGTEIFASCSVLSSVTLPQGLSIIPEKMFNYCSRLPAITIPASVTSIGKSAFASNSALTSITFSADSELEKIDEAAFQYDVKLESIEIPCTVRSIGKSAFMDSTRGGLKTLIFRTDEKGNTALETIGEDAFKHQMLETVKIPKSVTSIGKNAFNDCPQLTSFELDADTKITTLAIGLLSNCTSLTTITIPANVTTINSAFSGCTALATVIFTSDSLLTTLNGSFKGTAITSIEIPKLVNKLDASTFENCTALTQVTFASNSPLTTIGNYCFRGSGLTSIEIPANVTSLGSSVFENCTALTSVKLADKTALTTIGSSCFKASGITSFEIPAAVSTLNANTFENCAALTSVRIPGDSTLTKINASCFKASGIVTLAIPNGVTTLGASAFANCAALNTVTFTDDSALNSIASSCFAESAITTITLPKGVVKYTNAYLFKNCTSLESVTFLGSVTQFGNYIFQGCTSLTTITLPKTVTKLGTYMFDGCTSLSEVKFEEGRTAALTLGTYDFRNCKALTTITLPEKVTTIPDYAFNGCASLTEITLPSSLTSIGKYAFAYTGLTSINIPKGVTSIGENCFTGSHDLTTYTVDSNNTKYTTYDITANGTALVLKGSTNTFVAMPGKVSGTVTLPDGYVLGAYAFNGVQGVTDIVLPAGITKIPDYAFYGSTIKTITIPDTVTKIGSYAFRYSDITSIKIPSSVTEISAYAFADTDLASIEFAEGLTTIGNYAFNNSELVTVNLPASLVTIGNYAFADCSELDSVTFEKDAELTSLGTRVFAESALRTITLPKSLTMLYSKIDTKSYTFYNCENLESVTFMGKLVSLNGSAFEGCTSLKSITLPESLQYIGPKAFASSGLESIVIPSKVKSLYTVASGAFSTDDANTFLNCTHLTSVTLPEKFEVISASAFSGCTALVSIDVPASVTTIYASAFKNCTALTTINFAENANITYGASVFENTGLTSFEFTANALGKSMFANCLNLQSVTIHGALAELPEGIFNGCVALNKVSVPDTVTIIGKNAFKGTEALRSFNFPANLITLGEAAFMNSAIETVTIPASVTTIKKDIFSGCVHLTTAVLEDGCTVVGDSMFINCTALTSVTLPETITNIKFSAFAGCTALKELYIPMSAIPSSSNIFKGWTEDQTIYIACSEFDAATQWLSTWNMNCEATIVWDYVKGSSNTEAPKTDDATTETTK